ncbi:MAG: tetratricopeptide repeat protein [Candidatus Heimdallarchaeota archaeon]|nr:tetratricopeptide repeat protein [Candidatus Heimdallarchaeota archaeon]
MDILHQNFLENRYPEVMNRILSLEGQLEQEEYLPFAILKLRVLYRLDQYQQLKADIYKYRPLISNPMERIQIDFLDLLADYELGTHKNIIPMLSELLKRIEPVSGVRAHSIRASILTELGKNQLFDANFDLALETLERAVQEFELSDEQIRASRCLSYMGLVHAYRGELSKGLNYQFKALSMVESEYPLRLGAIHNNFGLIYQQKGDLVEAAERFQLALETFTKAGMLQSASIPLSNLGVIYLERGMLQEALEKFMLVLEIDEGYRNVYNLSDTYYYLIFINIEMNNMDEARQLIDTFETMIEGSENPVVLQRFNIVRARFLAKSNRIIDKGKAQELLWNIIKGSIVDYNIFVDAQLAFCDLLIDEMQITGEEEIIIQLLSVLNEMEEHANREGSYINLSKVFILKSQIWLLQMHVDCAYEYLDTAADIVSKHQIKSLDERISHLYDELLRFEKIWAERDISLKERIKEINLSNLVHRMLYSEAEPTIEENPELFIIMKRNGMRVYSYNFSSEIGLHEELISGLLTSMYGLSNQIFDSNKDTMQRIQHDKYNVIIKARDDLLFCYAFLGPSFQAVKKINSLVNILIESDAIWEALNRLAYILTEQEIKGMNMIIEDFFLE